MYISAVMGLYKSTVLKLGCKNFALGSMSTSDASEVTEGGQGSKSFEVLLKGT